MVPMLLLITEEGGHTRVRLPKGATWGHGRSRVKPGGRAHGLRQFPFPYSVGFPTSSRELVCKGEHTGLTNTTNQQPATNDQPTQVLLTSTQSTPSFGSVYEQYRQVQDATEVVGPDLRWQHSQPAARSSQPGPQR